MTDLCDGCFATTDTCPPSSEQETTIMKCPCTLCLVKPMCNTVCEEWQIYWDKWVSYSRRYGYGESPF